MKRCRKHFWKNILVHHEFEADCKPGAINEAFGFEIGPLRPLSDHPSITELERHMDPPLVDRGSRIEICAHCRKVRSPK